MSNRNRVKILLEWRREDAKVYAKIPIARGKEERPVYMMQRLLTTMLIKKWVTPIDIISFAVNYDKRRWLELLNSIDQIAQLKEENGNGVEA